MHPVMAPSTPSSSTDVERDTSRSAKVSGQTLRFVESTGRTSSQGEGGDDLNEIKVGLTLTRRELVDTQLLGGRVASALEEKVKDVTKKFVQAEETTEDGFGWTDDGGGNEEGE